MNCHRPIAFLLLIWLLSTTGMSQTVVLTRPVADSKGMAAFQITEILRTDGFWEKPLVVGQLLYPKRQLKAHPLGRFGEGIIVIFKKPGVLNEYQWLTVHNGYIPALHGLSYSELVHIVETLPAPVTTNPGYTPSVDRGPEEYAMCPLCKQKHIRIR